MFDMNVEVAQPVQSLKAVTVYKYTYRLSDYIRLGVQHNDIFDDTNNLL